MLSVNNIFNLKYFHTFHIGNYDGNITSWIYWRLFILFFATYIIIKHIGLSYSFSRLISQKLNILHIIIRSLVSSCCWASWVWFSYLYLSNIGAFYFSFSLPPHFKENFKKGNFFKKYFFINLYQKSAFITRDTCHYSE